MSNEKNDCTDSGEDKTPGTFSWHELITQDVDASKAFYTGLLGWSVETMDMGGGFTYSMFMQGARPIGGMIKSPKAEYPTSWIGYITVENLDATVEKALSLGAQLCMPITNVPGKGRFASLVDPQGAPIAFWQFV